MADKITTTNILAVGIRYTSDYTTDKKSTIFMKLPNPQSDLTEQQIKNVFTPLLTTQEGQGGAFLTNPTTDENFDSSASVHTAYTEYQRVVEIDLGL